MRIRSEIELSEAFHESSLSTTTTSVQFTHFQLQRIPTLLRITTTLVLSKLVSSLDVIISSNNNTTMVDARNSNDQLVRINLVPYM